MRTRKPTSGSWAAFAAGMFFMSTAVFGQTVSSQATVPGYATASNGVDKSAAAAPNDLATFTNAVAAAFQNNNGGVFSFPAVAAGTTVFRGTFGTGGTRQVEITSSRPMQSVANNGSFTQISDPVGTAQNSDTPGYTLTIGPVQDAATGEAIPTEGVTRVGFTVLSRTHATYPADVRAVVTFGDGTTETLTAAVGNPKGSDDTFFGFTAPAGKVIQTIELSSLVPGTQDPVNTRIALDDFGLIVSAAAPPPVIQNVSPANYAIHAAEEGIQFEITAGEAVPVEGIRLVLNGQDVTGQLAVTGAETNRVVVFDGLAEDQEYTMELSVSNRSGVTTLNSFFYTATDAFTLYDSEGFTSDTLYPLGFLQAVTHGRASWEPHASEPANVVQDVDPQGKVLEKINSGASLADWLHFPAVSSGTLVVEFDAFASTTSGRTLDFSLSPEGSADMATFVALGGVADKLAWYDNTAWQPIADQQPGWHNYRIVNYLSGPAAGYYDVYVDDVRVGEKLRFRNMEAGTPVARLRFHSQNTNPILEYGRMDNLVITAAPEDPNAFPPPAIVNFTPASGVLISPSEGFRFAATSALAIAPNGIQAVLNGVDITADLEIGGTPQSRIVTYDQLTQGRHVLAISVMNAAGTTVVTQSFIAATGPLVLFDSEGFESDTLYPEGPLQPVEDAGSTWLPAAVEPGEIWRVEAEHQKVLRRVQTGVDRIDNLRFPPVSSGILTIDLDVRVSNPSVRTLDFCLIHATSGSMASFIGWGTVPDQFSYFDGVAWIGVTQPGTDWHHYTTVNYLSGPKRGTFDLKVDGTTVGEGLPFRHALPEGTAVGTIRVGAIRGEVGQYGEIDNLVLTIEPLAAEPAALTLRDPAKAGNTFSFAFDSQAGASHVVEYKDDLDAAAWTTLETITGDGTAKTVTDSTATTAHRFYRVRTP